MFTHVVFLFFQQYQRGARQKWSHPKKQQVKTRRYKYLCPAVTLHKWKKKTDNTKISQFLYIKQPVWLLFRNPKGIFNLLLFCFFNFPLLFQLSDALWITTGRFAFCLFCFTLQNYTSIHIFSSLNSSFETLLKKQQLPRVCWIPHTRHLRLQNCFFFFFFKGIHQLPRFSLFSSSSRSRREEDPLFQLCVQERRRDVQKCLTTN